ncbi:putative protein kinase AGC-RSK-2 family [Rosa chinensis]|uniref:non-specific serine/threonine protein kinase n=1 Tax=Rosa chinensis TaxID=74649 RepID=A0A2P6QDG4_ROSCH|nr:serine/threonine-protein kinase D6PK [Rosa chinensis]XP_024157430.1 serine/threonine-protein kinase D6PK [Rosa chinensis]XP_024157431.1 serine/threonine-protein kinase D6PK [Rosa chinensis]PRQ32207.1 putative protein kinase AGC-RSK-2 family [Rosa chinensis]
MSTSGITCEIVEAGEEVDSQLKMDEKDGKQCVPNSGNRYSIEDDINKLFQAIDVRNSGRASGPWHESSKDALRKSAMKKPMRASTSKVSGIGISEPVSLKQALRGLCISQASEMAAMKRLSRPGRSSGVSEAGTIKRLYRAVVVEENGSDLPMNEGKGNFVEISLVPDASNSSQQMPGFMQSEPQFHPATTSADAMMTTLAPQKQISSSPTAVQSKILKGEDGKLEDADTSSSKKVMQVEVPITTLNSYKGQHSASSLSGSKLRKSSGSDSHLIKPVFRSKNFVTKNMKQDLSSGSSSSKSDNQIVDNDLVSATSKLEGQMHSGTPKHERDGNTKSSLISSNHSVEMNSSIVDRKGKADFRSNYSNRSKSIVTNADENSRSREKGDFSQSSKSSIGDYSSSTSTSEESTLSGSGRSGKRPHMSKDLRWEAIHHAQKQQGSLGLRHFKMLRKLGSGDIGTVYLAELTGTNCVFAVKVMDNESLATKKKMIRAQTEREILEILDHPFLPTLYAHFVSDKLSCLVMEYCPGGDLHVLRQKQPGRSFCEQATRFYVSEVLLAMEYLHMQGVVYRDLKPENILVRDDGHIMLTDFDLSLRCAVNPMLLKSSSPVVESRKKMANPCIESSCIDPFCLQPAWQGSCFTPRILSAGAKSRKIKSELAAQVSPLPQLVVEPTDARSNSFVGTHEYLAPEIIKGEGHGSAVDWWTFGIFLFELLYGKTPFKGSGNEDTLANVVSKSLKFPNNPIVSFHARDLIRGLLIKDPENRLGSVKGAAEIKQHPFFEGLNWALVRCAIPPEMPKLCDSVICAPPAPQMQESTGCKELEGTVEHVDFELF